VSAKPLPRHGDDPSNDPLSRRYFRRRRTPRDDVRALTYSLRMPGDLRARLAEAADAAQVSLNYEIVRRLERSFMDDHRQLVTKAELFDLKRALLRAWADRTK
jgi:hypothetical protein